MSPIPEEQQPEVNMEEETAEKLTTTTMSPTPLQKLVEEATEKYKLHHFDHKLHVQEKLHHTEPPVEFTTEGKYKNNFLFLLEVSIFFP